MKEIAESLVVGGILLVIAIGLLRWHFRQWREQRDDPQLDERERRYFRHQFRRRIQVSALLIVLGFLIPIGDALMVQRQSPRLIALLWIGVLIIALWIMLLGAFDWLASRMHVRATRVALGAVARKRAELEAEIERLRERRNGAEPS